MFAEFGNVRSVLLKSPLAPQQETQHMSAITSMLPIYSMAYVNFDTEESAAAALALNRRNPMSKISVTYYERQPTQPVQMEADPRNATNYRILFITKMNKRLTEEELRTVCAKYGTVQNCRMNMGTNQQGHPISLGKAQVTYSTNDEANLALNKLHFESALGDYIEIDFFKSRALRQ